VATATMKLKKEIANEVYSRRNAKHWSQGDLAQKAGVTQARISEIENGSRDYRIETAERVLRALGCRLMVVGQ
jgi:transcriptional regulator with XRE-family HTH domain